MPPICTLSINWIISDFIWQIDLKHCWNSCIKYIKFFLADFQKKNCSIPSYKLQSFVAVFFIFSFCKHVALLKYFFDSWLFGNFLSQFKFLFFFSSWVIFRNLCKIRGRGKIKETNFLCYWYQTAKYYQTLN